MFSCSCRFTVSRIGINPRWVYLAANAQFSSVGVIVSQSTATGGSNVDTDIRAGNRANNFRNNRIPIVLDFGTQGITQGSLINDTHAFSTTGTTVFTAGNLDATNRDTLFGRTESNSNELVSLNVDIDASSMLFEIEHEDTETVDISDITSIPLTITRFGVMRQNFHDSFSIRLSVFNEDITTNVGTVVSTGVTSVDLSTYSRTARETSALQGAGERFASSVSDFPWQYVNRDATTTPISGKRPATLRTHTATLTGITFDGVGLVGFEEVAGSGTSIEQTIASNKAGRFMLMGNFPPNDATATRVVPHTAPNLLASVPEGNLFTWSNSVISDVTSGGFIHDTHFEVQVRIGTNTYAGPSTAVNQVDPSRPADWFTLQHDNLEAITADTPGSRINAGRVIHCILGPELIDTGPLEYPGGTTLRLENTRLNIPLSVQSTGTDFPETISFNLHFRPTASMEIIPTATGTQVSANFTIEDIKYHGDDIYLNGTTSHSALVSLSHTQLNLPDPNSDRRTIGVATGNGSYNLDMHTIYVPYRAGFSPTTRVIPQVTPFGFHVTCNRTSTMEQKMIVVSDDETDADTTLDSVLVEEKDEMDELEKDVEQMKAKLPGISVPAELQTEKEKADWLRLNYGIPKPEPDVLFLDDPLPTGYPPEYSRKRKAEESTSSTKKSRRDVKCEYL